MLHIGCGSTISSVNKWVRIYLRVCRMFVCMYMCIFVQCICIWIENLESKPLTSLTVVTCDEWEVGWRGLEEERTVILINVIVNCDFFKWWTWITLKISCHFSHQEFVAWYLSLSLSYLHFSCLSSLSLLDSSLFS